MYKKPFLLYICEFQKCLKNLKKFTETQKYKYNIKIAWKSQENPFSSKLMSLLGYIWEFSKFYKKLFSQEFFFSPSCVIWSIFSSDWIPRIASRLLVNDFKIVMSCLNFSPLSRVFLPLVLRVFFKCSY